MKWLESDQREWHVRCEGCGESFPVKIREVKDVVCPSCGGAKATFVSGREFFIKAIEVI